MQHRLRIQILLIKNSFCFHKNFNSLHGVNRTYYRGSHVILLFKRGPFRQGCGSGSGLDPDSVTCGSGSGSLLGILIPDPGARKFRK
jgi:hypothetical protein